MESHRSFAGCRYDIVFATEAGTVRRCSQCGALQLRFGNGLLGLAPSDLGHLLKSVAAYDHDGAAATGDPREHAVFHFGDTGIGFRFTRDEVAELHRLLSGTQLLLEMRQAPSSSFPPVRPH